MDPEFQFPITLPQRGSRNRLRALHGQLKAAILDGRLQPGLRLPATRALAAAYGVSRNTAVATYDLLLSEGYLSTRPRAGAYVTDVLPQARTRPLSTRDPASERRLNAFWRDPPLVAAAPHPVVPLYDFRLGVPDIRLFPFDVWRRLWARSLRALARGTPAYASPQGRQPLREAIAKHVAFARAVACHPDNVVVTSGAQQAFDLLARILVTPGRTVIAIENPGYPAMRAAFSAAGARIAPVRVDDEGLVVSRLPGDARIICVTPSHQYPLGVTMSTRRRAALLEFARSRGAVIIEDDYDGEFRFGGRPLDALQTLDRSESVFYVGTFAKSLFAAMRLGFIVAPPWARRALVTAKQCADWHCSTVDQDTLASFIAEGHLARHVRRMRQVYGARLECLTTALQSDFGRWLEPIPSVAGMHLATLARPGVDVDAIVERARQQDVGVYSLRQYYAGKPLQAGLMFGYGAMVEADIVEALDRLRRVMRK